jgi:hypothetical protein
MLIKGLFERRELWTVGIYRLDSKKDVLNLVHQKPMSWIGETGYRIRRGYQSTVADPFLFVAGGKLYVFYEVKTDHGVGEIWCQYLSDTGEWISVGLVLSEKFHLSYPQVFEYAGRIYMLPESVQSGQVILYSAIEFPIKWKACATLVNEQLSDPTLLIRNDDGILLFGTTRQHELKMYHSNTIEGSFSDTGIVVSNNKSNSRCAGGFFETEGSCYRAAQDCSRFYGERIQLLRVTKASCAGYAEELYTSDLFPVRAEWMELGTHHLSSAEFNGSVYVAVDGRRRDKYVNTLLLALLRIRELYVNRFSQKKAATSW